MTREAVGDVRAVAAMLKTDAVLSALPIGPERWLGVDARRPGKIILPQIDGLRGVAICAVIFQHAFSHGISPALVATGFAAL